MLASFVNSRRLNMGYGAALYSKACQQWDALIHRQPRGMLEEMVKSLLTMPHPDLDMGGIVNSTSKTPAPWGAGPPFHPVSRKARPSATLGAGFRVGQPQDLLGMKDWPPN